MKVVQTKDTLSDIYLDAVRIRQQVFVKEQGVPADREIDQDEANSVHFVLYSDKNEPMATVRLLPLENGQMKLQRMAVLKEYRRQNLGKKIVEEAEIFSRKHGYNKIILGAQLPAVPFYEKIGYKAYGERFIDANIEHLQMEKRL